MLITPATSSADYAALGDLMTRYVEWCRERYAGHEDMMEAAFGAQDLAAELRNLADKYGPPSGRAFLTRDGDAVAGCGAYRHIAPGICELKRVFVAYDYRGRGLGKAICTAVMAAASTANLPQTRHESH